MCCVCVGIVWFISEINNWIVWVIVCGWEMYIINGDYVVVWVCVVFRYFKGFLKCFDCFVIVCFKGDVFFDLC